jgi:hypothetical protein
LINLHTPVSTGRGLSFPFPFRLAQFFFLRRPLPLDGCFILAIHNCQFILATDVGYPQVFDRFPPHRDQFSKTPRFLDAWHVTHVVGFDDHKGLHYKVFAERLVGLKAFVLEHFVPKPIITFR